MLVEFGTWYQINCETEDEWERDFLNVKDLGFDFVVLWNISPVPQDLTRIVRLRDKTLRAMDAVEAATLPATGSVSVAG
ncbi:MAG: hypothetical protein NC831_04450 [Candidatus Omnitrophica bacterium]|nr:hypothetical protein [Candidatus Omnitrophota bacterium]MCM8827922.1 hypothetical protein [Candidatus Omnitrophota bacterium]